MGKYKRRTERANVNEENMMAAIKDIKMRKMTLTEASKHYGILKGTIFARMKRIKARMGGSLDDQEITVKTMLKLPDKCSKYASKQIFTTEEEKLLVDYLLTRSNLNYGLTLEATRELAFEFAVSLNRKLPESWPRNLRAGKDWAIGFLKRHREISLRKPENTSIARNTSFNESSLSVYYDNLQTIMSEYPFEPSKIWNVDETGLSTVLQAPKVLAATSAKQVGQCVSNERGETVTIVGIVNAAGESIPPVFIFPRKRIHPEYMYGSPEGSIALFNAKGYMNTEDFVKTLDHIRAHAKPSKENPILIVLDSHGSHLALPGIRMCRESGMHMVTLPPHTSHRTQPLDLTVFGPFKSFCKNAFNDWLAKNPGQRITVHNIARICASAIKKSFTSQNIISGFATSGIYPLDRSKIFANLPSQLLPTATCVSEGSEATPVGTAYLQMIDEELLDIPGSIPSTASASSASNLVDVWTPPAFSGDADIPGSIPNTASVSSASNLFDVWTTSAFSGDADIPGSVPSIDSVSSANNLVDVWTPPTFSGDVDIPGSIPTTASASSASNLFDVWTPPASEAHVKEKFQRSSSPLSQPIDLSVSSAEFHGEHELQVMHSKRSCLMTHKPLDLSMGSLASSATSTSTSLSQLRFGQLEILRPIPNPHAFQKNSRVGRGITSTIVTGSPEFKKKEELEMRKNMKKEKMEVKKKEKMEVKKKEKMEVKKKGKMEVKTKGKMGTPKIDTEMPKKRGRPRKAPVTDIVMTREKKTKKTNK